MIFPLPLGKNDDSVTQSISFTLGQWKYHFFTQKYVEIPQLYMLYLCKFKDIIHYKGDRLTVGLLIEFLFILLFHIDFIDTKKSIK